MFFFYKIYALSSFEADQYFANLNKGPLLFCYLTFFLFKLYDFIILSSHLYQIVYNLQLEHSSHCTF